MNQEKQNASVKDSQDGEKNMKKEILSWVFYILFVVALTYVIITFVGQRTRVDGRSMMNTLSDGDNLIVEKLSYRFGDPERFDIIVFRPYENEKEYYIKRIIGLPGETVQIDENGKIYINASGDGIDSNGNLTVTGCCDLLCKCLPECFIRDQDIGCL